jgi:hypothetical protein
MKGRPKWLEQSERGHFLAGGGRREEAGEGLGDGMHLWRPSHLYIWGFPARSPRGGGASTC